MKKYMINMLIVVCLGTFSWAQGSKELFDAKKSQEELEIMKGILSTTMSFVSQNLQKQASATVSTTTPRVISGLTRYSNINAFYLYGQGAVFVIPTSSFRSANFYGSLGALDGKLMGAQMEQLSAEMAQVAAEADKAALEGRIRSTIEGEIAGPKAVQTPKPAQPYQSAQNQEELRKKLTEQVEKAKKLRLDTQASREQMQKMLEQMKVYLVEALANYGDSITTVKPNEYINVVITTNDSGDFVIFSSDPEVFRREVISVQKSWITDYKAGRLTLDAFKQKALQYRE